MFAILNPETVRFYLPFLFFVLSRQMAHIEAKKLMMEASESPMGVALFFNYVWAALLPSPPRRQRSNSFGSSDDDDVGEDDADELQVLPKFMTAKVRDLLLHHLDQSFDRWSIDANVKAAMSAPFIDSTATRRSAVAPLLHSLAPHDTPGPTAIQRAVSELKLHWPSIHSAMSPSGQDNEGCITWPQTFSLETINVMLDHPVARQRTPAGYPRGVVKTLDGLYRRSYDFICRLLRLWCGIFIKVLESEDRGAFRFDGPRPNLFSSTPQPSHSSSARDALTFKGEKARRQRKRPREAEVAVAQKNSGRKRSAGLSIPLDLQMEVLSYLTPRSLGCAVVTCQLWFDMVRFNAAMRESMNRAYHLRRHYRTFFEDDWGEKFSVIEANQHNQRSLFWLTMLLTDPHSQLRQKGDAQVVDANPGDFAVFPNPAAEPPITPPMTDLLIGPDALMILIYLKHISGPLIGGRAVA